MGLSWPRVWKLTWRWSLVAMAVVALFWGVWEIFGEVPTTTTWGLSISRWWDVLFGLIWVWLIIWWIYGIDRLFWSCERDRLDLDGVKIINGSHGEPWFMYEYLFFAFIFGGIIGLVVGLIGGIVDGLVIGLILFSSSLGAALILASLIGSLKFILSSVPFSAFAKWLTARNNCSAH